MSSTCFKEQDICKQLLVVLFLIVTVARAQQVASARNLLQNAATQAGADWAKINFGVFNESHVVTAPGFTNTSQFAKRCYQFNSDLTETLVDATEAWDFDNSLARIEWNATCEGDTDCSTLMSTWQLVLYENVPYDEDGGSQLQVDYTSVADCTETVCTFVWKPTEPWSPKASMLCACPADWDAMCMGMSEAWDGDERSSTTPQDWALRQGKFPSTRNACCLACMRWEDCYAYTWFDDTTPGLCVQRGKSGQQLYNDRLNFITGTVSDFATVNKYAECRVTLYSDSAGEPIVSSVISASQQTCATLATPSEPFYNAVLECKCYGNATCHNLLANSNITAFVEAGDMADGDSLLRPVADVFTKAKCDSLSCVAAVRYSNTSDWNAAQVCLSGPEMPVVDADTPDATRMYVNVKAHTSDGIVVNHGTYDLSHYVPNLCWMLVMRYSTSDAEDGQKYDLDNKIAYFTWTTTCYGALPCNKVMQEFQLIAWDESMPLYEQSAKSVFNHGSLASCSGSDCSAVVNMSGSAMEGKVGSAWICPRDLDTLICNDTKGLDDDMYASTMLRYRSTPISALGCCYLCQAYEDCSTYLHYHWDTELAMCTWNTDNFDDPGTSVVPSDPAAKCDVTFYNATIWDANDLTVDFSWYTSTSTCTTLTLDLPAAHRSLYPAADLPWLTNVLLECNCWGDEHCFDLMKDTRLMVAGRADASEEHTIAFEAKHCTSKTCAVRARVAGEEEVTLPTQASLCMDSDLLKNDVVVNCTLNLFDNRDLQGRALEYAFMVPYAWVNASTCQEFNLTQTGLDNRVSSFQLLCDCDPMQHDCAAAFQQLNITFHENAKPVSGSGLGEKHSYHLTSRDCNEDLASCMLLDGGLLDRDTLRDRVSLVQWCVNPEASGFMTQMGNTSAADTPTANDSAVQDLPSLAVGMVVGVVVAGLAALAIVVVVVVVVRRRRRRKHDRSDQGFLVHPFPAPLRVPLDSTFYLSDFIAALATQPGHPKNPLPPPPFDSSDYPSRSKAASSSASHVNSAATPVRASRGDGPPMDSSYYHSDGIEADGDPVVGVSDTHESRVDTLSSSSTSAGRRRDVVRWLIDAKQVEMCRGDDGQLVRLGRGATSEVYKGIYEGAAVAIKVLNPKHNSQQSSKYIHNLILETNCLKTCDHPNIIKYHGSVWEDAGVMLVFEFMCRGNLFVALHGGESHVSINKQPNPQYLWKNKGKHIALGIAKGLEYLHRKRIVHCDIKCHNVMLNEHDEPKIGDMGMSKMMLNEFVTRGGDLGTLAYAAPEQLTDSRISNKVDVYSFGVILWEIVTGELPHVGPRRPVSVPDECSEAVKELITLCTSKEPTQRPSAAHVLKSLTQVTEDEG